LAWLLANQNSLATAKSMRWSQLQPLLTDEGAQELIVLHTAKAELGLVDAQELESCRQQLEQPAAQLNPPPLATGEDLISLGIPRGPIFAQLLKELRDAQLDGVVKDKSAALEFVRRRWKQE